MELISQGVIEMYEAPLSDTIEAEKIYMEIQKTFRTISGRIAGIPINILD